jgi:hypothetical protein
MLVHVHETEDGSGWVKVVDDQGGKGLVPASYIELLASNPTDTQPLGQYGIISSPCHLFVLTDSLLVRGIYNYSAQGPDELTVAQGELIKLSRGPAGGQNYGDGWWEGE